jgi:hypothetical protein
VPVYGLYDWAEAETTPVNGSVYTNGVLNGLYDTTAGRYKAVEMPGEYVGTTVGVVA